MKLTGKTTPIALRLSNDIVARVDEWAWKTGQSRGEILAAAFTDWLNALNTSEEYPTRTEARNKVRELRAAGTKAYLTGGKNHWRVFQLRAIAPETASVNKITLHLLDDTKAPGSITW